MLEKPEKDIWIYKVERYGFRELMTDYFLDYKMAMLVADGYGTKAQTVKKDTNEYQQIFLSLNQPTSTPE